MANRTTIRDIDVRRGEEKADCINCGKETTRRVHPGQMETGFPVCWDCQHFYSLDVLFKIKDIITQTGLKKDGENNNEHQISK